MGRSAESFVGNGGNGMKTLYVADLDGTLLNSKGELSSFSRSTINSLISHGLDFTINTSRTPKSAEEILSKLELKLPAIMMNGSAFYDRNARVITEFFPISKSDARKAAALMLSVGAEPFLFSLQGEDISVLYSKAESPYSNEFIKRRWKYYSSWDSSKYISPDGDALYIVAVGDEATIKRAKLKIDSISGLSSSLFNCEDEGCFYLEIYSAKAGKWQGLKSYMQKYGFSKCVCFGDNLNDIEMLKNADIGICVANGYSEAKAVADVTIGAADDDAVAKYLMIEWSRS